MQETYAPHVTGDTDYATRLGLVVRTARYFREMSREDLGARTDFNPETIARWERGDVTVPGYALARLSDVLELPADLLIDPPATRSEVLVKIAAADVVRARPGEPAP